MSAGVATVIDTTPPWCDLVISRGVAQTYHLTFTQTVTGQVVSFSVKRSSTKLVNGVVIPTPDSEALLTKNSTGNGITVANDGLSADLVIDLHDCDDPVAFPERRKQVWGVRLVAYNQEVVHGSFTVVTVP